MANKKKGPEGFNDWYERNGGQAQETQTRQTSNSSGSAKPQAFNDWYNAGANEPYTTLRFLADDMAGSSRVRAQSRSAWLQEMQYKQQKQQMDKTNSDIAAYNEFQRRQYNQALGNAIGKMAAAPIKGGKRGNIDPATLASIGGKVAKGAGNKANSTINVVRNNWEVPDGGNQPRSRGTNDAPYAIAPGAPVTDNSEYEARRMALDELIRANRNMNSVTGSYVMDDLLGYQREKSPERTEQKEDATPQHVQQFATLSSADIKARQDRYNEMVESDLTLARNLLSATFAGVEPARSMARDELGNKWGINAYDAEELRLLADRLERGVVYTDKDGNETTWDKLYNNALNREKAEASILPPEEQAYVQSLYDMTSDELEKKYGAQDDETKTGDLSTAEWLLNATVPWFEYDENSEVGQARARLNAEYGIDPTNENDLRTLIENLKTYEAGDVIYTDSNGKNYTYQDLYYNAENREKFNKLETDSGALDLVAEGLRLQKQIDMFNAYIVDAGTAAEYAPMVTDLGNKKNLIAERLNERGYDLDRMLGYLNTEDAKQRFLMQSQATAKWTEENPVLANIASMLATPVQAVEWMANNTGSGNPEDLKNYVPMNYFGMDATNFSSAVRGTTSNMIQNEMLKAGFSDKFAELASETYSGVLSAAQSRILALACTAMAGPGAGEIISLAIMGSSAASDTLRESIDRGLDNRHAIITAMSAGVAEAAFEELSLDKFLENVLDPANLPKGILDALRKSQLQRLVEGSEEFFTDIANAISDRIINGDMSEYNTNIRAYMQQNGGDRIDAVKKANADFVTQVLQSAFGGYIGGGGFGSFALNSVVNSTPFQQAMSPFNNAYNRYQQNRAYQNIGASVIENQNTGALVDAAQMSGDEQLRGLAEQVAEAQTIQKPSRRQQKVYEISTGKLAAETAKTNFQKATESNESVLRRAIETELKNRGLDATDNNISAVRKALSGEELTYDEKYPSYRINAPEIAEAMKERTPEIEEEASKISQEAFARVEKVQKMANADFSERVSKTGEVINTETGKAVEIGDFVKDGDNGITLTTKDGGRVSVADLQFADTTQAALYEEVDAAGFSPEVANQVVRGFDGKGTAAVSSYMNGMLEGMAYGRTHQNTDMNFSGPFYADLSESQKDLAIKLGQMERGFDTEKATAKINELKALSGGVQRKGSVTGVTSSSAGLNNAQRTGIRTIEMLVDNGALTNNFHFFSSVDNGKGRVMAEDVGGLKKGDSAPNGFYDPKTGDIYIDVNAGNNGEGTVLFTAAHEVTHFVKQWSPNKFNDLANFLVQEYHGAGISVDGLVREQMRKGSSRHLSYDEAFEEMVADSMQTMFTDGNLAAKLMDLKAKDKTLFDRIMQFVKKLQTGINKVYARYTPDSEEAKALSQIKGAVDRLADTFAEGITAATENYSEVADSMSNEAAFADSDIAIKNQIRTPYTEGTNAWREFIDGLNPEARETHDLFYNFYTLSRLTNTTNAQGKPVKNINISSVFLTAQQWNEKIAQDKKWNECAKKLAASLPDQVRKNMNFNLDGTLTPVALETRFKMQKSMAQRLVDSLGFETIDNEYELGGKKISLNTAGATQSVGGEAYRRALINETRKLYDSGKLKQVSIHTMSKDRWGSLGFLAANEKTGASGDLTTLCPQMMYNEGCFYCYRRAAMETGVNNKLVAQSVWYTGEILRIKDADIESLNEKGGLRIQSFGDWMPHFSAQLADILYDAETRGLQVKIITKEPSMIDYVARLRDQGIGLNLYFNISADYAIERGPAQLDNFNPDSLARVNPDRPFMRGEDNSFWWKRALAVEEGAALRKKYPWVNVRIVATTQDEFIRGLKDPNVQVVTGYHGNKREWDRVDSTTGEHKVIMEALGDAGMPRFRYENGQWVREYDGKTKTHQALADAIEKNGLQQEYYIKTCCITGRCATCQGKCGAYANSFYVKNATNDPQGTAYWYNQMSNVQLEESDAIEVEPSLKQSARDTEFPDRVDSDVDTSNPDYHYSARITDPTLLDSLNNQEYITTYRTMQIIDGGLYSPMNSQEEVDAAGKRALGFRSELGQWEMATEAPEKTKPKKLKTGEIVWTYDLKDPHGDTQAVAYNPYEHSANYVLNDQFTGAYKRKNIVVVECRVPVSESNGAYRAYKAHNATGWTSWHKGPVASKIAKATKKSSNPFNRQLFLSRYLMPVRIIPDAEVAKMYGDYLRGTGVEVNWNVVSPSLLEELVKQGVPVTDKPSSASVNDKMPENLRQMMNQTRGEDAQKFSNRDYMSAVNAGDMKAAQRMVDQAAKEAGYDIKGYHGTTAQFNTFKAGDIGIHFGKQKNTARTRVGRGKNARIVSAYLSLHNPINFDYDLGSWDADYRLADKLRDMGIISQDEYRDALYVDNGSRFVKRTTAGANKALRDILVGKGYDGIEYLNDFEADNATSYIVFNADQIKSADPVTYDNAGNVIPLSERFNEGNQDIRYSTRSEVLALGDQVDWMDDRSDIKEQLKKHKAEIDAMNPVANIQYAGESNTKLANLALDQLTAIGGKTIKRGSVVFDFDKDGAADIVGHAKGEDEKAAAAIAPYILKYGKLISGHKNHKGRNVSSLTYAAPAIINGVQANVGATVVFTTKGRPRAVNVETDSESMKKIREATSGIRKRTGVSQISALHTTSSFSEKKPTTTGAGSQGGVKESARNSDGNALSPDQVEYFKDSKIRDEDGNLLVVYHGTDAEFTVFDRKKGRSTMDIQGMFFSPWDIDAAGYGSNVQAYYLNIKNPAPEGLAYKALNLYKGQNNAGARAREYLEKRGYDGVNNGNEEFIAFNSEQIKKVDNKKPTSNPDVRFSERDSDAMDTRTVLSNALLDAAQNDTERKYIADYQSKIQAMNEEQNRLNEIRNDIRNMTFGKAPHTKEHLKSLKEEATRLANRINVYDKQLLRIEAMKPMKAVVERETSKVKARIRADQAAFMTDYKNRATSREYIARIEHEVKGLRDRLLHPSAKTIIPESFAKPAAEFLAAIDFSTFNADGTRRAGKANATRAELQSRLDALAKSIDNASLEADYGQLDLSPDMKTWIDSVKQYLENNFSADDDYVLRKMDAEQLKDLYKMVVALRTAVNRAGKMYTNMSTNVADLGAGTIDYLEPLFNRERSAAGARVFKTLGWDYAQPVTVFDRFGDSGKQVYKGLLNGQKKEAENVQTILDFVDTAYTKDEINKWRDEMHEVTIGGSKYNVPTSYIQELYCMMKDADARRHIVEGGGIRFDDLTYGKAGRRKTRTFENTMISEAEVQAMLNMLTPRQKEVADQIQEFMDRIGADWGNEISMTRFGYHAFGQIQNYYPIRTIKQGSEYEAQQKRANIYALLNKSFTKERVDNANNTVIIGDIFKTFSNHMSEMAVYNAWALPVIDTIKWFNYSEAQDLASGTPERSVKDAIRKAYGAEKSNPADEYIRRLLESINSQKSGGLSESLAFHSLRMMNRVAVAANVRVAVQQPFSITRAFEMINPRFVRPMKPNTMRSEYQEMVERTSFGRWKGLGYYDVDISRPLEVEILKNSTVPDRVTEWSMGLAERGDRLTWTTLWHACKLEAQHNGLTGEAMLNAAAEKFDELIARTQVVDSVLTKSQWMRSDSFWHRMTSAFMSEPMTSYNALLRRYDQFRRDLTEHGRAYAWKNNGRNIAASVALYALTQVVNALVTAPIDASRDDDDYKTWLEKMLERFKKNALENIIPTSMMPYISDIAEYAIYGSEDRSDLAMYTKVIDTAKQIYALFDKEKYSVKKLNKAIMSSLSMISSLSGLPLSNAFRDAIAIWNTVVGEVIPAETTDYGSWKFQTAEDKNTVGYQQFIKALQDDNEDRAGYIYMQMISNGLDGSGKLNDNILAYYRKNASGDADDTENAAMLNKMMTIFGEDDAEATSEETSAWWEYTGNNPDTFLADAKAYKHYYEKIMPTGISAEVYNDYRQNLMDNGYNLQAEIIPVIDSLDLTREQKDALYTDNGWTKIGLENTPWHASATPGYGDYTRRAMSENLDNYMSAADYREYLAEIEPYGIDDFTWTNYSNFIKKVKGQDTTGDGKNDYTAQQAVMDYIEALPLTDKQKDALYLKKYSEKNIDKAPWRQ